MNYTREIAGVFVGVGALVALWKGETALAAALLAGMLGFFVGERNGARTSSANKA